MLRVLRELPVGEGAALTLGCDEGLEFVCDPGLRPISDDQLIGQALHAQSSVGHAPTRQPCRAISIKQCACER